MVLSWSSIFVSILIIGKYSNVKANRNILPEDGALGISVNAALLHPYYKQLDTIMSNFYRERISSSGNVDGSSACETKLFQLYSGFTNQKNRTLFMEALTFLDAAGKPGSGITQGNLLMMGSWDICKSMENNANFTRVGYYKPCLVKGKVYFGKTGAPLTWQGCLPEECRVGNFSEFENTLIVYLSKYTAKIGLKIDPGSFHLTCEEEDALDTGAYIAIVLLGIVSAFVCIGTVWYFVEPLIWSLLESGVDKNYRKTFLGCEENGIIDEEKKEEKLVSANGTIQLQNTPHQTDKTMVPDSTFNKLVKCFALQRAFSSLLSTHTKPGQVLCLNGIRVLSINWVVLGHLYLIPLYASSSGDVVDVGTLYKRLSFSVIVNALPSVDTFFTLSGFLVSYLLLKQLHKRNGSLSPLQWISYYIHRYLRLTIPYALVILLQAFLYRYFVNGPFTFWQDFDHLACSDYWWANLLYVNNFVPANASELCIGQSWYLANDFQFYLVAPLFIVLLYKVPKAGILSTIGAVSASAITAAILTYMDHFGPTTFTDSHPSYMHTIYIKPYIRISPYLIGICGGWIYWQYRDTLKIRINRLRLWKRVFIGLSLWIITFGMQYGVVFGLHDDIQKNSAGQKISTVESVSYEMLARISWGLSLIVQILMCQLGLGGVINSFLSWKGWIILSRLTYAVYLLHFGLIQNVITQLRHPFFFKPDYNMQFFYLGSLGMSYLAATVLFTCVEQPLSFLEAMTYRKQ